MYYYYYFFNNSFKQNWISVYCLVTQNRDKFNEKPLNVYVNLMFYLSVVLKDLNKCQKQLKQNVDVSIFMHKIHTYNIV